MRTDTGWKGVGIFLALFQFVLPFLILMPRERKRTLEAARLHVRLDPRGPLRGHLLGGHARPLPGRARAPAGWTSPPSWAWAGSASPGWSTRLRGHAILPARDPYLADSLHYEPQQ